MGRAARKREPDQGCEAREAVRGGKQEREGGAGEDRGDWRDLERAYVEHRQLQKGGEEDCRGEDFEKIRGHYGNQRMRRF